MGEDRAAKRAQTSPIQGASKEKKHIFRLIQDQEKNIITLWGRDYDDECAEVGGADLKTDCRKNIIIEKAVQLRNE